TVIDPADRLVTLDDVLDQDCAPGTRPELHPLLRRWDHHSPANAEGTSLKIVDDGALPIVEGPWIDLEDGVQVRFEGVRGDGHTIPGTYRRGDYWQIPARTITGDVEWPQDNNGPVSKAPDG